jgi:cytochrome c oxidase subunit IV
MVVVAVQGAPLFAPLLTWTKKSIAYVIFISQLYIIVFLIIMVTTRKPKTKSSGGD